MKNKITIKEEQIGRALMKKAHEIVGGEKDIAVFLIANENAIPFLRETRHEKI